MLFRAHIKASIKLILIHHSLLNMTVSLEYERNGRHSKCVHDTARDVPGNVVQIRHYLIHLAGKEARIPSGERAESEKIF